MSEQKERFGTVEAALPRGLFRVVCDDGRRVTASLGGTARRVTVRIKPGDRVALDVSPLDPTRARIKARHR